MEAGKVREKLGPDKIIGVSCKTVEQALLAKKHGADYLGVGAMYPTGTKKDATAVTPAALSEICHAVDIPVVAIGGINKDRLEPLKGTGVDGVAVVSAIFAAEDIEKAAKELKEAVRRFCRGKPLLFAGRKFSELKIPYDAVVVADLADSECEVSAKSCSVSRQE